MGHHSEETQVIIFGMQLFLPSLPIQLKQPIIIASHAKVRSLLQERSGCGP